MRKILAMAVIGSMFALGCGDTSSASKDKGGAPKPVGGPPNIHMQGKPAPKADAPKTEPKTDVKSEPKTDPK